jgi:hypothetical protein
MSSIQEFNEEIKRYLIFLEDKICKSFSGLISFSIPTVICCVELGFLFLMGIFVVFEFQFV